MAIGGFNGSDPSPTLAQFQQYVADGEIHYFIAGGGGFGGGPGGTAGRRRQQLEHEIASLGQRRTSPRTTVDGVTVYDLSGGVAVSPSRPS